MDGAGPGEETLSATRRQLVAEHLQLASDIAAHLRRRHRLQAPLEDLEAYARTGLVEAAHRFDPGRGIPFAHFAHYRITGALWDGVRAMGWQAHRSSRARFEEGANSYLAEVAGERPHGAEQLARSLEERTGSLAVIFLAALDGAGDEQPDERDVGPLRALERAQLKVGLQRTLGLLPPRERRMIEALYWEGRQLRDVASELGLSVAWASRLHRRAVERFRSLLRQGGLIS